MVPFSNGRRESANPSSRVIVLPSLESQIFVVDQSCCFKLGIPIPNQEQASRVTDHTRTEKIGGDSILFLVVLQVVAGNRYDIPHFSAFGTNPYSIDLTNLYRAEKGALQLVLGWREAKQTGRTN